MSKKAQQEVSEFDFETYRQTVIQGLMQGKGLTGEEGLLKPLIANFIEGALAAELGDHLIQNKAEDIPNKRNGQQTKPIRTQSGEVQLKYSRDRNGTFEPITVKKRQHELGPGFDNQILELYATSNSVSDIRTHLERMYGAQMSESRISNVINQSWDQVEARRKLDDFGRLWKGKYDLVVNLWLKDWDDLMGCMNLSGVLRKLIYTTNAIENLNREIRRLTKAKGGWVSDRALLIQLFLALDRKKSSWNKKVFGWKAIHRELAQTHGERFTKHIS